MASPERRARVYAGYEKLEPGMSKDQVAALIGEPDYSEAGYGPKGPGERWLGSSWTYWLGKQDDGVNLYDPMVEVFFGTDGRADRITSSIRGLREKRMPSGKRAQSKWPARALIRADSRRGARVVLSQAIVRR